MSEHVIQFEGTIYENGYGLLAQKVMRDKNLPKQSKLIYAYMCSFAGVSKDGERTAFPSVSLQCAELGMSEDTYYKWRKELITAGYIKIKKQRKEDAKFDKNIYSIVAVPQPVEEEKKEENSNVKPYPNSSGADEKPLNQGFEPYPNSSGAENPSTENSGTNSNSSIINSFNKDLDTIDTKTKKEKQQQLMEKSFYKNGIVPKEITRVLDIFSIDTEQADFFYKIILSAKKNAGKELNMSLTFEDYPELTEGILYTFGRSIRIIERNKNTSNAVKNPSGYIYTSIYKYIVDEFIHSENENPDSNSNDKKEVVPDWFKNRNKPKMFDDDNDMNQEDQREIEARFEQYLKEN